VESQSFHQKVFLAAYPDITVIFAAYPDITVIFGNFSAKAYFLKFK